MRKSLLFLLALAVVYTHALSQTSPEIRASDIQRHLQYLASPELAGRGTGSEGNRKAAAYIADWMKREGLKPLGDSGSYFQRFEFISTVTLGGDNRLVVSSGTLAGGKRDLKADVEFRPLAFTANSDVTGPLVFAGYGLSVPDSNYDDYHGLDVHDKIVVVFRYGPDGASPRGAFSRFTSFRNKARIARDKGASGIIFINGPRDDQEDDILKLAYDQSFESSGIPAVSMKREVVEDLLRKAGTSLRAIQDSIAAARHPFPVSLGDASVHLKTEVEKVRSKTANVVGLLEGSDPALKDQALILGAHFDHLGMGGRGSGSLVPDTSAVHPGADDNASGTSGLLELMESFAARKQELKRSLIFVFFTGEELGTLGSSHYVNHPPIPLDRSVAMLNMDMVGRLENRKLTVYGTGTSPVWKPLLQKFDSDSTFALSPVEDGFGPSDQAQFYGKDMPVLFFFTGIHNDYHKPSDTWEKINYPGEEKIVRYVANIVDAVDTMAERPSFVRPAVQSPMASGDTRSFSVTLGIIPDFGGESVEGMRLGGVKPSGPADKAGMKTGDIIVKMAGKKVLNVYDYMGILGELKAGDRVEIEALRDGKAQTFQAVMEKRK